MKTSFTILLILAFLSVSCEKDNSGLKTLQGNWVIKKILVDPGDGSGRYQDAPDKNYIAFLEDGSAKSNFTVFGLHLLRSFKIRDNKEVILSFKDISSQPDTPYRFSFTGDTLTLTPPCIEACGLKLVRSN